MHAVMQLLVGWPSCLVHDDRRMCHLLPAAWMTSPRCFLSDLRWDTRWVTSGFIKRAEEKMKMHMTLCNNCTHKKWCLRRESVLQPLIFSGDGGLCSISITAHTVRGYSKAI